MKIELSNAGFTRIWNLPQDSIRIGDDLRDIFHLVRKRRFSELGEAEWDIILEQLVEEIRLGDTEPREFAFTEGLSLLFSVTKLTNGRRLISFLDQAKHLPLEMPGKESTVANGKNNDRLANAIEALDDGFVLYDKDDRLVICNDAFREQFGEMGALLEPGKTFVELTRIIAESGLVPGIEGKEEEFINDLVAKRQSEMGVEKIFQTHDGRWIKQRDRRTKTGETVGTRIDVTHLKQQEDAIRDTSQLLDQTSQVLSQGILVFEDEKLKFHNPAIFQILGLGENELPVGISFLGYLQQLKSAGHYGEGKEADEAIRRILEMRRNKEYHSVERPTGDGKYLKVDVVPFDGNRLIITYTDITETHERNAETREALAMLDITSNTMPLGLIVFDKGKVRHFNDKMLKFNDIPDGAVYIGQKTNDYLKAVTAHSFTPETTPDLEEVERRIEAGEGYVAERVTKSGTHLRIEAQPQADGSFLYTYFDITEDKRLAQEIAEREELLNSILSASENGILVTKGLEDIITINDRALSFLQLTEEDLETHRNYKDMIRLQCERNAYTALDKFDLDTETFLEQAIDVTYAAMEEVQTFYMSSGEIIRYRVRSLGDDLLVHSYVNITEEKKRERDIETSSQLLTEATSTSQQGILVLGEENIEFFNQKSREMLGVPDELMAIGAPWRPFFDYQKDRGDFGNGDQGDAFIAGLVTSLEEGNFSTIERKGVDGRILMADRAPNALGGLTITFVDITEIKKQQQALQEAKEEVEYSHDLQTTTANAMANGLIVFQDETMVLVNPKAKELLELPDELLTLGLKLEDFFGKQRDMGYYGEGEKGEEFYQDILSKHRAGIDYEVERVTKSGNTLRVNGVSDGKGKLILTFNDITSIKKRQAELHEAKTQAEELAAIQSASADAMVQGLLYFKDKTLRYFNTKFFELTGANEADFHIGMPLMEVLGKVRPLGEYTDEERAEKFLKSVEDDTKDYHNYKMTRQMLNGKTLQVDSVAQSNGVLVATYSDITELKAHERELERKTTEAKSAERAKSEFLANMSHEIRTPMNGVMGMAELLATTELDAKQKMFTDVIVKSGASLLTIINDILDFSKIDAGQMELDPAPFNLAEAIEDVATLVSAKVVEKDLELIVRVDPKLPKSMIGDVGRIRQVITNLLGNAVKFTEKGHVYVNVDGYLNDGGMACLKIAVEDTGIGIPQDKAGQVFNKFNQVDTSATRKHEGTGLGLSIASSLVKLMGGEINIQSEVGVGSTFWFEIELPAVKSERESMNVVPSDMSGARILIIDDNEVNRSILMEQMTAWKFDSAAASSGREGLALVDAVLQAGLALDLIVLDYQMPDMDGADVLQQLRQNPVTTHIPVLMLTSVDSSESNRRLSSIGVQGNMTKPTRSSLLLETIMQIIANARIERASTASLSAVQAATASMQSQAIETASVAAPATPGSIEADQKPAQSAEHQPARPNTVEETGLDVLVAEDNEVNQIVFTQILEETGLSFKIVENGRLAVAAFKSYNPRLILMDVSMPEMNGKEATSKIRELERAEQAARTPIVGVTAHALKGDMESCLEAGMDDYLSKPVSPEKLVRKIEQWLKLNLSESAAM